MALTNYTATSTTPISFATDIYPLLGDMGSQQPVSTPGCASATICHGLAPITLNSTGAPVTQSFTISAAMVLAELMVNSVNAPSMKRVVPGNVGASFLAYKISGADGLACVNSSCVSGASVGTSKPCGDPMPTVGVGVLSAAQKTLILDWIAQGANP